MATRSSVDKLNSLSLSKRDRLIASLVDKWKKNKPLPAPRRHPAAPVAASFEQERLWFLDQLEPGNPAYLLPNLVRLQGRLNLPALAQGLNELLRRHESLRTSFRAQGATVLQEIAACQDLPLPVVDLSGLRPAEREPVARRLMGEQARRVFDLTRSPLLRAVVLRSSELEHFLLLNVHHIVADAWSMALIIAEVGKLYPAYGQGQPSPLADLPIQFADYALQQRERLGEAGGLAAKLAYWKGLLSGAPTVLELAGDRARPAVPRYQGATRRFEIAEPVAEAIRKIGLEQRATPFISLLTAFGVLLYKYSGQPSLVIGSPVANRQSPALEQVIGFFVNTLALRLDIGGGATYRELIGRTREMMLEAGDHQDLPLGTLLEHLAVEREANRSPLFQVMFGVQNIATPELELGGLRLELVDIDAGAAKFDMTLMIHDTGKRLAASLEYDTDLFEGSTIERLELHFQVILAELSRDGGRRIGEISVLSQSQRQQVLIEWNDTSRGYGQENCIQDVIGYEAGRRPDQVGLVQGEAHVTYEVLEERSNQLANYLIGRGIKPEELIGVSLERGVGMVVGLLGVLKAGGAYVPLDPGYPSKRLAYMLEDASPAVVISAGEAAAKLPAYGGQILRLDSDWAAISQHSKAPSGREVRAANAAYVLYTSGSTGEPKGVIGLHGGIMNRLKWMWESYGFAEREVCCAKTSLNFVDSVWEIFGALGQGMRLILIGEEEVMEVGRLVRVLGEEQVTRVVMVPSLLQALLASEEEMEEGLRNLRIWVSSGEALRKEVVERFKQRLPGRELLNLYGSSEVAGDVTAQRAGEGGNERSVGIGRPIANTEVYGLDGDQEAAPIGVMSELYVGGSNLARGYHKRAEMTAERFVPNGYKGEGERLFRTGDVVRQGATGELEYVGRRDQQVKVRGYRIELGEIEAALNEHEQVAESVVVVRESEGGEKQVVAYVVWKKEGDGGEDELKSYVRGSLPGHMVPSRIMRVEQMPMLPNGKIDRRGLAKREVREEGRRTEPRNAVEELISGIWTDVLGVEEIGIEDNFFDLGGHSLLAMQAISRVRVAMQVEMGLRVLFENPTVEQLAESVERERGAGSKVIAPEMVKAGREGELPASYAQQRLWFIQQLEPDSAAYNIPVRVRLAGPLSISALRQTLQEIARRHEVLRTRFVSRAGQAVQVIDEPREIDLPLVDLTGLLKSQRESLAGQVARREAGQPFDLARGPVWRPTLVRMNADEHLLVVTMHHIASDGWSAGVMVKEFTGLYEAVRAGHQSSLSELSIQYADYALWQREWLRGEVLEQQLEYWRRQLAAIPVLELPVDRPRTAEENRRAARQSLTLSTDLTKKLIALSRREGVTLFMTLLAGFQLLLARYTGQDDVAVGAPVSGRNRGETERLIGFFVNMLVLRTDLSGVPTLRELLRSVRKTALDAYAHQDVPFEKLVEELRPERSLSRHPFFEILFNHVNAPMSEVRLADLTLVQSQVVEAESKFPMTVYLSENHAQINLEIVYQQALFSSSRIATVLDAYRELLSQMVEYPDRALASYTLVTSQSLPLLPDPREELRHPNYAPVGEMFNEWAVRLPRQLAVSHRGKEWSYEALSNRARNIAGELISSGLETGRTVMVTGEKSLGMIASVLATCMSGGVLFTLDRAIPADRQKIMSDTSGVTHILYVGNIRGEDAWMFERDATCVLRVDSQSGAVTWRGQESLDEVNRPAAHLRPLPHISPQDPAYIFFTSGTTGVPKGVLGSHQGLSHFLKWQRDEFEIRPGDRSAQLTGLSFDVVLRDIFLPLTSGAALCLPDDEAAVSSGKILGWLDRQRISVLHTVPALAQMWLTSPPSELRVKDLRIVFFAGEPLTDSLVKAWRELCSNRCEIINLYGPTETTLAKCYYRVPLDCPAGRQPVGRPMPHTQALILRNSDQLCGIGELGEVAIRTPFRTLGYIAGDELNRQRFVKNPFRADDHDLIYMTGDLARYREDGLIELTGRVDDQVKIRGIRVEPGEIATLLAQHPGVRQCAVLAREDEPGNKRLVAYVVPAGVSPAAKSELREYLRHKLPDYMVPATFVEVPELPLTANGKIDRKALPPPDFDQAQKPYAGPRSFVEEALVQIWSEVLRVDHIGIDDPFFELGGHSLLATQVISRIDQTFHVEIPLRHLFEHPTVESLAIVIEQSQLEQLGDERLSELLARLSKLTDDEVEAALAGQGYRGESDSSVGGRAQGVTLS